MSYFFAAMASLCALYFIFARDSHQKEFRYALILLAGLFMFCALILAGYN